MPSITDIVTTSHIFQNRMRELGIKDRDDPNYGKLQLAQIEIVKDAILERNGYELGIVRGGELALQQLYQRFSDEGLIKGRKNALNDFTNDQEGLETIATRVVPARGIVRS